MAFRPNHYGHILFNENEQPTWSPTSMPENTSFDSFQRQIDDISLNLAGIDNTKTGIKKQITIHGTTYQVPVYRMTPDYVARLFLKSKVSGSLVMLLSNKPSSDDYTLFWYNYGMDRAFHPVVNDAWFEKMRGTDITTVFPNIPYDVRIMGVGKMALWGINNNNVKNQPSRNQPPRKRARTIQGGKRKTRKQRKTRRHSRHHSRR
jgi:hypothetical protein